MPLRSPLPSAPPAASGRPLGILYLSDLLGAHDHRFLSALASRGHRVTLVTYLWDIDRANFVDRGWDVRRIPGVEVVREPSLCAPPVTGNALTRRLRAWGHGRLLERRAAHVAEVAARTRPDVVHAGWVQTSGWYAARAGLKPLLVMPWGSDILLDARNDPAMRARARWVLERADAVTCDCEIVKREIQALVPLPDARFLILPWGVDLSLFPGRAGRDAARRRFGWGEEPVLVSTRTFRSVYAVDAVVRAFAELLGTRPDARLALVGDGPEEGALRALASSLGCAARIDWLGYCDGGRISELLSAGDFYLSPSRSDGSSVSLLEAMASGLPCLVSDLPGNREWVEEGVHGHLVPPGDGAALAARLRERLADPEGSLRMGAAAQEVIRSRADWHRNIGGLEAFYRSLPGVAR